MRRFEKTKGFVIGVAVRLVFCFMLTPALAQSVTKQINAYYNDIKIMLNGQELIPKDAAGKVVEPFISDGTTYLPVRALSEALGLAVSYDGKTSTVYLGANPEIGQPTIWLKEMKTLVYNWTVNSNIANNDGSRPFKDNRGNSHSNYLMGGTVTFALDGQYSNFTGKLALDESNKSTSGIYRLAVYLDDELAFASKEITAGVDPFDFEVPLTGALRMKINIEYKNGNFWQVSPTSLSPIALINAGLWK